MHHCWGITCQCMATTAADCLIINSFSQAPPMQLSVTCLQYTVSYGKRRIAGQGPRYEAI